MALITVFYPKSDVTYIFADFTFKLQNFKQFVCYLCPALLI